MLVPDVTSIVRGTEGVFAVGTFLGISSEAWIGFAGALVGGLCTLAGQFVSDRYSRKSAKKDADDLVAATALLMQDDFEHYQATLARALDRCTWWDASWLLVTQATVDDRKTVWARLKDDDTRTVANAQGWMDVLISQRQAMADGPPPLARNDVETMKMTFDYLEDGRAALAVLARRPATPFTHSRVLMGLINCRTIDELRARDCPGGGAPLPPPQLPAESA